MTSPKNFSATSLASPFGAKGGAGMAHFDWISITQPADRKNGGLRYTAPTPVALTRKRRFG